jgi:hypothetical protein
LHRTYTRRVKLTRTVLLAASVSALMLCGVGCGGIQASKSISPLDFFLPGLLHNPPPQQDGMVVKTLQTNNPPSVAQSL